MGGAGRRGVCEIRKVPDLLANSRNSREEYNADREKKATPDLESHVSLLSTPEYGCTQGIYACVRRALFDGNPRCGLVAHAVGFGRNFAVV